MLIMDIQEKIGVRYIDILIFIVLFGFFYYGAGPINMNKPLTSSFVITSIGFATFIGIFYSLVIAKPITQKIDNKTYDIWKNEFNTIKQPLDFINKEIKKKIIKTINFKELENNSEKLFLEVQDISGQIERYNIKRYVSLSSILFLLSTVIFMIDLVHPIQFVSLQQGNNTFLPLYFSLIGFLVFLVALWYTFRLLIIWHEVQK
jgi:hypothetical protein